MRPSAPGSSTGRPLSDEREDQLIMAFRRSSNNANDHLLDDVDDPEIRQDIASGRYTSLGSRTVVMDPQEAELYED